MLALPPSCWTVATNTARGPSGLPRVWCAPSHIAETSVPGLAAQPRLRHGCTILVECPSRSVAFVAQLRLTAADLVLDVAACMHFGFSGDPAPALLRLPGIAISRVEADAVPTAA